MVVGATPASPFCDRASPTSAVRGTAINARVLVAHGLRFPDPSLLTPLFGYTAARSDHSGASPRIHARTHRNLRCADPRLSRQSRPDRGDGINAPGPREPDQRT